MRVSLLSSFAVAALVAAPLATSLQAQAPVTQQASAPAAPVLPAVGELAPDFTAAVAGKDGVAAQPVTLSALRGKVVVLAFYPADRTSGCTAELTKFRDEHAKLFGDDVVVLPISRDSLSTHASWAKEMSFPFALVSDTEAEVAKKYGSQGNGRYFARTVFVIGRDGRIAHVVPRLNALSEDAYTSLGQAVAAAKR